MSRPSLAAVASTSAALARTRSRLAKTERLAALLRSLGPDEVEAGVSYLTGQIRGGPTGVGYSAVASLREVEPSTTATLGLTEVEARIETIRSIKGKGSTARRAEALADLFSRATGEEQHFLARLLVGELRQGALEGVMAEAIAHAADVPPDAVRRAVMLAGDPAPVARAALAQGAPGLAAFQLRLFEPVQPMLASPASDVTAAMEALGTAALEYKLDGARVQIHKDEDEVRIYSRSLRDVTASVPEIAALTRTVPARRAILDGEVLAMRDDARPHPFQVTMRRFGRKLDVETMQRELPLSLYGFDCLLADDDDLLERPGSERAEALRDLLPEGAIVPWRTAADGATAQSFLDAALAAGHEGIMAKSLDAPYAAGSRGAAWLKIKQAHTLDLVVLAAEWGSGRRRGWLSNLHLGARDPSGGFVMLGKTFKGLTDEILTWQTERLQALATHVDGHVVHVRPELVVEIAFNELQASRRYPGGLALRFARLVAYRADKPASEADTIDTVRALFARAQGEV